MIIIVFILSMISAINVLKINITCDYLDRSYSFDIYKNIQYLFYDYSRVSDLKFVCDQTSDKLYMKTLYFKLFGQKRIVLEDPIDFNYLNFSLNREIYIKLSNFKGFNTNTRIYANILNEKTYNIRVSVFLVQINFDFYLQNKMAICDDRRLTYFTFSSMENLYLDSSVKFSKTDYCPFILNNTDIKTFYIKGMYSSVITKNYINFIEKFNITINFSSNIQRFQVLFYRNTLQKGL